MGERRRTAVRRWWPVTLGALVGMPINVVTAVSVSAKGPMWWNAPWLGLMTM